MSCEVPQSENPRKWRFTWEAQSHIPSLRLFVFNPFTNPSTQCLHLKLKLLQQKSSLTLTWLQDQLEVSISLPIPRVLIDVESPLNFKALPDHIQVQIALLLPVDHPLVSTFDSILLDSDDDPLFHQMHPLFMDSGLVCTEIKNLSSREGVQFCCTSCSTKLTRSLRLFEEMPSVNWREVADNWFGSCCCSFGSISEKLVTTYAKSYACATGVCLLNTTSVVLCKDDLLGFIFSDSGRIQEHDSELDFAAENYLSKDMLNNERGNGRTICFDSRSKSDNVFDGKKQSCIPPREDNLARLECEISKEVINGDNLSCIPEIASASGCNNDMKNHVQDHVIECCTHAESESSSTEQKPVTAELQENQKSFLNGFLGNCFMARSSNLSNVVHWMEVFCPQCSCLLGAYPRSNDKSELDSGVHLFKCYISTCLPVKGSGNLFRKYTLERMFTNQLLESAKDELSFRTVVRDLQTKSPMLQVILLNTNSWCCTGNCLGTNEPVAKMDMCPTVKVLFSDCSNFMDVQLREIEEWVTKNEADEVYMLESQIKELIEILEASKNILPPSNTILQGLTLSSLRK